MRSTNALDNSKYFSSRICLQCFALFLFCLGTLGASAQDHPKAILEIPPVELMNPIERVAIEADYPNAVLNAKGTQETQPHISKFVAPASLLLPSNVILAKPTTTSHPSAVPGLLDHSQQIVTSDKQRALNQRRGRSSSAPGDMDNDGLLDSLDLCPNRKDMALDFDGIDDYVNVPHDAALNVGVGDFTLEAWVHSTTTTHQAILCKGSGHAGTNYLLSIEPSSVLGFYFADEWHYGSATIPINEWSHVAVSYDFSTKDVTFYVNGVVDVVINYPNTPVTSDMNSLYLGQAGYSCQCIPFEGRIDDVAIWNIKRSTEEIACGMASGITGFLGLVAYYNMNDATAAACMDNTSMTMISDQSTSGFYDGLLNNFSLLPGCTSNWSSGRNLDSDQDGLGDGCDPYCYEDFDSDGILDNLDLCPFYMDAALDFDGIDDHVTVPHNVALNVGGGDFTMQAWINPSVAASNAILCKGSGSAGTDYILATTATSMQFYYGSQWHSGTAPVPINQWSHLAVTFDYATKEATFFVNGVLDVVVSYTNPPDTSDTNPLFIGQQAYNPAGNHFPGRIDDVSIWNTKRTAEEITCSMAKQLTGSEAGLVAFYEMNETAACIDNTATTMMIDQSPNGFDGLLNNFSLLPGCTSNWSSGRNLDSDQNGIGDGCDGICIPADIDRDGILDSIDLCPDYMDTALDFDGIDDHITVTHDAALNVGRGDFTFQAWVNPTSNDYKVILAKGADFSGGTNYKWDIVPASASSYKLRFFYGNEGAPVSTTAIPLNEWNHIAMTFESTAKQAVYYLNGVADGIANYTNAPDTTDTQSLYIGRFGLNCACNHFEGRMDDVSIWNRRRTPVEIACGMTSLTGSEVGLVALYDMNESSACIDNTSTTTIVDQSPNGLGGQLNNFSLLPGCTSNWSSGRNLDSDQDGLGDGCSICFDYDTDDDGIQDSIDLCPGYMDTALDFDGVDDHITVPHHSSLNVGNGDFTLQAWVNPTAPGWSTIMSKGYGGAAITDYLFTINPSLLLGLNIKNGWTYSTTAIPLNTWSHVAVSFNFTTQQATFYLNGIADGGGSFPAQLPSTDGNPLFIGQQGYNCACNHFKGRIDDVAIWNKQRTASDFALDMTTGVDVSEAGLVASYDMNEAPACLENTSITMIVDQSPNGFDGLLNNFSLLQGCTSNWSSGRNLDSDQDGVGDGCQFRCNSGLSVLYVDSSAIDGNNLGNSWSDAYVSLSDALYHASQCSDIDSIHVAAGTYFPDIGGLANPRTASFVIPEGIQILGQFPMDGGTLSQRDSLHETILSGDIGIIDNSLDNAFHVVYATNITSASSVDGFIITNGYASGGGIDHFGGGWLNDNASPRINQCMFIDNSAFLGGGGLLNITSSPKITNCTFSYCKASQGGAINNQSASSPTFTDCHFTSNTASDLISFLGIGGAVVNSGNSAPVFKSSRFTSNTAELGGAIFMAGSSASINQCSFTSNTASSLRANARGGAIASFSASTSSIDSCFFNGNVADNGGGIFNRSSSATVSNCIFQGNQASKDGGGMYDFSPVASNIDSCIFIGNTATTGGGLRIKYTQSILNNCTFESNASTDRGGGLYSDSTNISLLDCDFKLNTAMGRGGGLSMKLVQLSATNMSVDSNSSNTHGGGLYLEHLGATGGFIPYGSLTDCQFDNNMSSGRGGGVFSVNIPITALRVSFDNNSATGGGGLYGDFAPVSLTDCQYTNNTATKFGGGIGLISAPLSAQNLMLDNNSSNNNGGGLYSQNALVALTSCQLTNNMAVERGGGMSLLSCSLVGEDLIFSSNSSDFGGGLVSVLNGTTSLMSCDFLNNTAVRVGGGMLLSGGTLNAQYCNFSSNTATLATSTYGFGGAIWTENIISQILSFCDFSGNLSTGGGGACGCLNAGASLVNNCTFRYNQVLNGSTIGTGGAYQVNGTGQTDFSNCLFEANQALGSDDDGGGAIMVYGGEVNLVNSTLVNNFATTKGGAVSLFDSTCTFTSQNSILWNNKSATDSLVFNGNGGSATMSYSLIDADSCVDNVLCNAGMIYNENPLFIDSISAMPIGGDFRLHFSSPAINAGINGSIPAGDTTDLIGSNRIINSIVDMGAYEFNYEFPCGVYGNLMIDDVPVFMGEYKASGLISSEGIINTNSNGPVSFKSESEIELNQGFEVKLGEVFNAVIEDPCVD